MMVSPIAIYEQTLYPQGRRMPVILSYETRGVLDPDEASAEELATVYS